jgi:hypothetical protein
MTDIGQSSWPEARGPHLPDRLVAVPLIAWPFVVLAVWAAVAAWSAWQGIGDAGLGNVVVFLFRDIGSVETAVAGAVFFWRHPDGLRRHPLIALGVSMTAISLALSLLHAPLYELFVTITPPDESSLFNPTDFVFVAVMQLVAIVGLLAIGRGLVAARERPNDGSTRGLAVVLTLIVVTSQVLSVAADVRLGADLSWPDVLWAIRGVAFGTVSLLVSAYIAVVAARGWTAGERPSSGWLLVAAAGVLPVVSQALLVAASWLAVPDQTTGVAPGVVPALWLGELSPLILLVAFALGLPAPSRDPEAATTPGSAGS